MNDYIKVSEEINALIEGHGLTLGTSGGKSAACLALMAELLQAGRGAEPYEVVLSQGEGGEDE